MDLQEKTEVPYPLILASNPGDRRRMRSDTCAPRQDYLEIARELGGVVKIPQYDRGTMAQWHYWFERGIRLNLRESIRASRQIHRYNVLLSTSEKIAIPLSAILSIQRQMIPHVVIAHRLSSPFKAALFRTWPLQRSFSRIICLSRPQVEYAVIQLGISPSRVDFVFDKVDQEFFQPLNTDSDPFILSVGQEQRDYETLIRAISGTGLKLIILASSPWSANRRKIKDERLSDVTVMNHLGYQELREMYARARLVAIPLFDVPYAAGVNTLLEAMAMGKPLIVTRSSGIQDYVVPGETGIQVEACSWQAMQEAILDLWSRPDERSRLGLNARQAVVEIMNLDNYVRRVVEIVQMARAV